MDKNLSENIKISIEKNTAENTPENEQKIQPTQPEIPETSEIKIGKTTYIVTSFYKENAKETLKDKLWRLIENDSQ
jgi:hypothetical protein